MGPDALNHRTVVRALAAAACALTFVGSDLGFPCNPSFANAYRITESQRRDVRAEQHEVNVDARASRPGTYGTIAAALAAAPEDTIPYVIRIHNGRYNERIAVARPNVQFVGQSRDGTILSYDMAAGYRNPAGGIYGTRGSSVLRIAAPGFVLRNMTVENTFDYLANYAKAANDSTKLRDAQALAVMLDQGSDRAVFENCRLSGHQDTLFPNAGRSYFHRCVVSGSVDFIFGAGRAVFDETDIVSRDRGSKSNNGYITAPSTPIDQSYGFLIINSRLLKETPALAAGTVSLGRPWHPAGDPNAVGSAVFVNTWMDDHIGAEGWQPMNSVDAAGVRAVNKPEDARFFEYRSKGPGAVPSPTRRVLTQSEAAKYTIAKVLDGWIP